MIILGIFLAFFGNKFVNAVIYMVAALAFFIVIGNVFFNLFMSKVKKQWVQWVILALIFIAGNFIGYLLVRFRKYGVAVLAAWGGVMLGVLVSTFFVTGKGGIYWGLIIGFGVLFGVLAFFIEKFVIQFITSFVGSYLLIRGISLFAGGFPNEVELHEQISSGAVDWSVLDKSVYGYLSGIILLTLLSLYFQRKHDVERRDKYAL